MSKNYSEVIIDREPEVGDSLDDGLDLDDLQMSANKLERGQSVTVSRIPLQEAMKNGNSANYFDALRRLNFKADVLARMDAETAYQFLCTHLVAATREVRPDVVRLLFQQITDRPRLHHILLYKDAGSDDETYTKTALEWAVENNDRLCTTEILHQEYECHRHDRRAGLNCLRRQLTGDELLIWTIETFTMFYEKTWAQSVMIPLMGLIPLFFSISTFVYDYYSDFELSYEYYNSAFNFNPNGTNGKKTAVCFCFDLVALRVSLIFASALYATELPKRIFFQLKMKTIRPEERIRLLAMGNCAECSTRVI